MQYKVISHYKSTSSMELDMEFFNFYGKCCSGQQEQPERDKRSINLVNELAGEMMGQLFVEKYFPETYKKKLMSLIQEIIKVMYLSIEENDWLSSETKLKAKEKLSQFRVKIGYPDKWTDYSKLDIVSGDNLSTIRKKHSNWYRTNVFLRKINAPLDWDEWLMTPQTVNAYFMPPQNEIVFPAAILQPPFFHKSNSTIDFHLGEFDRGLNQDLVLIATNLGGIGSVIAHEITHGYDDKGRKFDGKGNLVDWWLPSDAELFTKKTQLMTHQVEKEKCVIANKTYSLNSELTMGENLADLGGLSLSLRALKSILDLAADYISEHKKAYFQIFFKSFANIWKINAKDEFRIKQLTTDPHSPGNFRANLVKNMDEFYEAFDVKEGDKMYLPPSERLRMW